MGEGCLEGEDRIAVIDGLPDGLVDRGFVDGRGRAA